jgi:SAM-dependent methyltransferase
MGCTLCQAENPQPLEAACRRCRSLPEDRAFARFFFQYARPEGAARILDMAPPSPQLACFPTPRFIGEAKYTAVAPVILPEAESLRPPHRVLEMDITRLSFSDSNFDFIICNNVLPYVRSDFLAMSEVHRCLKAQGVAFLNVNVHPGKSVRAGEGNGLPGSGQEWSYGEDYFERLEAAGLFVQKIPLLPLLRDLPEARGLPADAQQVVCFKFRDAMEAFLGKIHP